MIIHLVNMFGRTPRHQRAQSTWEPLYRNGGMIPVHLFQHHRTSRDLGDPRSLPYLKDMLEAAGGTNGGADVILWTNDDIGLDEAIIDWCYRVPGAGSMRRDGVKHMGRDLFAFTRYWLKSNWDDIPDFIIGCPCFDLCLAAMIRLNHGIKSTFHNLELDIPPVEGPERYAHHEPHRSSWAGPNENKFPANLWNKRLANEWFQKHNVPIRL